MKTIEGCHGTCMGAAEEIRRVGFNPAGVRARVGPGAYFWAYSHQRQFAARLARAWYEQKLGSGEYAPYPDRRFALVNLHLAVQDDEFFDLDSVDGSEVLRDAHSRLVAIEARRPAPRKHIPIDEVYAAAVGSVAAVLAKRDPGVTLKVVKANVTPPNRFELPFEGWLTGSVGAYIVLPGALGELTFEGQTPTVQIV